MVCRSLQRQALGTVSTLRAWRQCHQRHATFSARNIVPISKAFCEEHLTATLRQHQQSSSHEEDG